MTSHCSHPNNEFPAVSINIVNWNGSGHLEKCLYSVYRQDYRGKIEITVVDNGSHDGSCEYIEKNHKNIALIKNRSNKGFAYAHNQAIRSSVGVFVLFLNFDIILEPDFISGMVKMMQADPGIGILSGKLYKQFNGRKSNILDSTGIEMPFCFMRPRGEMEEDKKQYDASEHSEIFGVCGAAAFCRRKALDDVRCKGEYFDEDFFNYVEDVDLSWRLLLRGWACRYNPLSIAYHERGVTRKNNKAMLRDYLVCGFRNRYCAMLKNLTPETWKRHNQEIIARELFFLVTWVREIPYSVKFEALAKAALMSLVMFSKRIVIQRARIDRERQLTRFLQYDNQHFRTEMLLKLRLVPQLVIKRFVVRRAA